MKPDICPRFDKVVTRVLCNHCFYDADSGSCSYDHSHLERNITLANIIKRM